MTAFYVWCVMIFLIVLIRLEGERIGIDKGIKIQKIREEKVRTNHANQT